MTTAFISYTHADEALKDQFLLHLGPLRREGLIRVWHDRMLNPGDHLDQNIQRELASSDLIILLISAAFLNSEYCFEEEMKRAFARQRAGGAKVVAVILRPCQWQNVPVGDGMTLSSFLAVPRDGKPVTRWADPDEAFDDAAGAIRKMIVAGSGISAQAVGPSPSQPSALAPSRPQPSREPAPLGSLFPGRVTDLDKDRYLKEAFETVASSFSARLGDAESSDPRVTTDFDRVDSQSFIATMYLNGDKLGSCRIFTGAEHFGRSICLSFDAASRNSMNEWLSVETSDAGIGLKSANMTRLGGSQGSLLDQTSAADFLWDVFIKYVGGRAR